MTRATLVPEGSPIGALILVACAALVERHVAVAREGLRCLGAELRD